MDKDRRCDTGRGEKCGPATMHHGLADHHGEIGTRNNGIDPEGKHQTSKL
jgi:hypothetical protein